MAFERPEIEPLAVASNTEEILEHMHQVRHVSIPGFLVPRDTLGLTNAEETNNYIADVVRNNFGFVRRKTRIDPVYTAQPRPRAHYDQMGGYFGEPPRYMEARVHTTYHRAAAVLLGTIRAEYIESRMPRTDVNAGSTVKGIIAELQQLDDVYNNTGLIDTEISEPSLYAGEVEAGDTIVFRSYDNLYRRPALHRFITLDTLEVEQERTFYLRSINMIEES